MSQWEKLLARMVADPKPTSYSYADAAAVLTRLGFTEETPTATSHRKWTRIVNDPKASGGSRTVTVGLNAKGKAPLKPGYIRTMVRTLRENQLLPDSV